jgi:hypothetical protein
MTEICSGLGPQFIQMAKEQDAIGWRQFMEGMICRSIRKKQYNFHYQEATKTNPTQWAQGLILKLLKATHRQWIYRNIQSMTGLQVHRSPAERGNSMGDQRADGIRGSRTAGGGPLDDGG